jgi:hypothetical protein
LRLAARLIIAPLNPSCFKLPKKVFDKAGFCKIVVHIPKPFFASISSVSWPQVMPKDRYITSAGQVLLC